MLSSPSPILEFVPPSLFHFYKLCRFNSHPLCEAVEILDALDNVEEFPRCRVLHHAGRVVGQHGTEGGDEGVQVETEELRK